MKPIIGITMFQEKRPAGYYGSLSCDYSRSIAKAGGIPILIPFLDPQDLSEFIKATGIMGLLFTGGADISPTLYKEDPIPGVNCIEPRRDAIEQELFKIAEKKKMPIMGICRGLQMLNVLFGGNLYQHIDSQVPKCINHHPTGVERDTLFHNVIIESGSFLYDIFGTNTIKTNSFHHQGIKKISKDLRPAAHSSDGIIEAFEYKDLKKWFVIGIQWHPENLAQNNVKQLHIFKTFINNTKK